MLGAGGAMTALYFLAAAVALAWLLNLLGGLALVAGWLRLRRGKRARTEARE